MTHDAIPVHRPSRALLAMMFICLGLWAAAIYAGWCLHAWCEPAAYLVPDCAETHVYPSPGPGEIR